uniref:Uncharacterized protein n=1 Tax=Cacopsylla melanoneura TaxID=428564 RepID=A0A8D8R3V4_9HEMI
MGFISFLEVRCRLTSDIDCRFTDTLYLHNSYLPMKISTVNTSYHIQHQVYINYNNCDHMIIVKIQQTNEFYADVIRKRKCKENRKRLDILFQGADSINFFHNIVRSCGTYTATAFWTSQITFCILFSSSHSLGRITLA